MARGKYEEWLEEDNLTRIESWASDGLTNQQIADNIGIGITTLKDWRNKYPSIQAAIKKGRKPVVRHIENALIKSAKGFEYEETTIEQWVDDDGKKRQKIAKHKRYSPPNASAGMFLLKNYKPEKYRNYNELTRRQIEAEIRKLEAEAKKAEKEADELELNRTEELLIEYFDKLEEVITDD